MKFSGEVMISMKKKILAIVLVASGIIGAGAIVARKCHEYDECVCTGCPLCKDEK